MNAINKHKQLVVTGLSLSNRHHVHDTILTYLSNSVRMDSYAYLSERFSHRGNLMFSGTSPPFLR